MRDRTGGDIPGIRARHLPRDWNSKAFCFNSLVRRDRFRLGAPVAFLDFGTHGTGKTPRGRTQPLWGVTALLTLAVHAAASVKSPLR
jgi:hypothetical protein